MKMPTGGLPLDRLKALVVKQFENGPPSGWLLGWDESRLHGVVSAAVQPSECVNETSFDYSFCNRFVVTPATRAGRRMELTVLVSFVARFYSIYWTRHSGRVRKVASAVDPAEIARRVHEALVAQGFAELPADWHSEPVPGVVLELAGASTVTLGKCLFEDSEA